MLLPKSRTKYNSPGVASSIRWTTDWLPAFAISRIPRFVATDAVGIYPGYQYESRRKRWPQSTRRRDAAESSIILCSDGMALRSVSPESIFHSGRSRSAANVGGALAVSGNDGQEWRIARGPSHCQALRGLAGRRTAQPWAYLSVSRPLAFPPGVLRGVSW
jgi:hypothetical protein